MHFQFTKRKHFPHLQGVFTFDRAAEDVSPAGIVNGPSTCPGETYQPGHSIWPLLETVYHLFHRESTVNRILLFLCMATTLFLNKWHVQGCGSANTEMTGMLNNIAKFLALIAICFSHTEVEDFLDIFLRWFMEVWKHEMSLQRHLQFGHGNANLLISSSNTLCFPSDINETLSFVMFPVIYWQDENYQKHDAISWGETLTEVTITEWLVFPEGFPSANCRRREGQLRQARWIIIAYYRKGSTSIQDNNVNPVMLVLKRHSHSLLLACSFILKTIQETLHFETLYHSTGSRECGVRADLTPVSSR